MLLRDSGDNLFNRFGARARHASILNQWIDGHNFRFGNKF